MQFIRDSKKQLSQSVVTIGNFDGLHKGHQKLIHVLVQTAKKMQLPSVLITLEPHPSEFFSQQTPIARLMRFSEKWRIVQKYGIDYFYCMRFNSLVANLSPEDFVKTILVKNLGAKKIIIGDDFRFGVKRTGDVDTLISLGKQYDFEVMILPQEMVDKERVSSSRVRAALSLGDFKTAAALTGRPFTLSGKVAYGSQLGRQLGYPTVNIYLHRKQVPIQGIFVACVHGLGDTPLQGVASIGYRPTFGGKEILLEVFIFDFDQEIYGRFITVEFLSKIRDEIKFDSVSALILQIADDVRTAKQYFIQKSLTQSQKE